MDSIYDNLENYNDANVIHELTNENNELKNKLQEYSSAMTKLQNDFDKLAAEYKKLEVNYSSLLKTARAEIERKSQVITDLNLQRDKMVLGTIQNRNTFNLRKNVLEPRRERDKIIKNETEVTKTKEFSDGAKSRSSSGGRKGSSRTPSEDRLTIEKANKAKKVNVDKVSQKTEISKDRNSNLKENISRDYKEHKEERNISSKPQSIKSRRKSMPAARLHCKFSSDDEREDSSSTVEANRKKLSRENTSRKTYDRGYNDKHDDRRLGLHTFHSRSSRKYDNDRSRDSNSKYEYSHRHRRNLSPERSRRRSPYNYSEEWNTHYEHSRKRVLESPTRNKHYHHKANYDRDNDDIDKHGPRPFEQERHTVKQKYSSDYDEPVMKRLRTNSFKLSEDENRQYRQKGTDHIPTMTEAVQLFDHVSCQSPDYLFTESSTAQPIREIKNTAIYPLEDPRENNKNYIVKTENGLKVLSTITGRNVELKPVDKTTWDIKQTKLPDPLREELSQCSDDMVRDIYMDLDNPLSNISTESGEILSFDHGTSTGLSDVNAPKHYENIDSCQGSNSKEEYNKKFMESFSYRIPKINKNDNTKTHTVDDTYKTLINTKVEVNAAESSKHGSISLENQVKQERKDNIPLTKKNETERESNKPKPSTISNREIVTTCQLDKIVSPIINNREIVEGDLELSDENYDNTDIEKRVVKEETVDMITQTKKNEVKSNENSYKENSSLTNPHDDIRKCDRKEKKERSQEHVKGKSSANIKKHKAKKKSHRQKSVQDAMEIQELGEVPVSSEINKEVKVSKEVKHKFCDLFGDSSSLITPEDLGLPQLDARASPKYVPVFEDAQDAIVLAKTVDEKISAEVTKEDKYSEKNSNNKQSKSKAKSDKNLEHKKKRSKKAIDPKPIPLEIAENVDSTNKEIPNATNLTTDSNVVQTVIISTGVQPQALSTDIEPGHLLESTDTITCHENIAEPISTNKKVDSGNCQAKHIVPESRDTLLHALATSTPAKPQNYIQPAICNNTPDISNNSNEVKVNVEQITPVVDHHSDSNTVDSQTDVEAPDVRIFIRRRKKGIKKAA